jgi:hypothetical protein
MRDCPAEKYDFREQELFAIMGYRISNERSRNENIFCNLNSFFTHSGWGVSYGMGRIGFLSAGNR